MRENEKTRKREIKSIDEIPTLNIKTSEFRRKFPTNDDFYNFINERNSLLSELDSFAGELANTLGKCPKCGLFTSMTDLIGIAFVEKNEAQSEADLKDNFFGCPSCFTNHLEKHSDKIGRIGF
jgi:hypothetical protein